MDKKLAKDFIRKVGPLEHSPNPRDRKKARYYEGRLRKLNKQIPKRLGA